MEKYLNQYKKKKERMTVEELKKEANDTVNGGRKRREGEWKEKEENEGEIVNS